MLQSMDHLRGYKIRATDGEIGKVHEFYFDDLHWTVRYMVVDTGSWLPGRRVLISPHSVGRPDQDSKTIPVSLTTEQVRNAPDVDTDMPVSRQQESQMAEYYGWPAYWGADTYLPLADFAAQPPAAATAGTAAAAAGSGFIEQGLPITAETSGPNLRASTEVKGYHIHATDDEIGHLADFLVDDDGWVIRYLVVDTRNFLPGKKVLVAPQWVDSIRWSDRMVYVEATKQQISTAPEYDGLLPLSRDYEVALFAHYGHKQYWLR